MTELLPAQTRCEILTKRIQNLNRGSGDYDIAGRVLAIAAARRALDTAEKDLEYGR